MRRDEYEELQRMAKQYRQHLQWIDKALKNVGLELEADTGIVRWTESPSKTNVAPTWGAQAAVQTRTYEVTKRMADVEALARAGVKAVIAVHNDIEVNQPMHPALENCLRKIEDAMTDDTVFMMDNHAGRNNNGYGYQYGR